MMADDHDHDASLSGTQIGQPMADLETETP
jgi:hypothetical protein